MVVIMKITKEQLEKWNEGCKNDFKVDISYLVYHSEKTLEKRIILDDETYLKCHLSFYNKYENYKSVGYYINANISKWKHQGDFDNSYGLGINIKVSDKIYDKKSFKELQKITENITDSIIIDIYKQDTISSRRLEKGAILW